MEQVILVNERDEQVGIEEKLQAHRGGGRLHRAFSIFLFNPEGDVLLQRRAKVKYHFGGLWSNTCCGHPRPGESVTEAAQRRLDEEFGILVSLSGRATLIYEAHDPISDLTEREFLHVLTGHLNGEPRPNRHEIDDWRWSPLEQLRNELAVAPTQFTPWLPLVLGKLTRLD